MSRMKTKECAKIFRTVRDNVKALRMAKGWSIQVLSEISGINIKTLADIENGQGFDVRYLILLCSIYCVELRNIFYPL